MNLPTFNPVFFLFAGTNIDKNPPDFKGLLGSRMGPGEAGPCSAFQRASTPRVAQCGVAGGAEGWGNSQEKRWGLGKPPPFRMEGFYLGYF